ncbi:unnamed protein product [Vitrella brassicaformis CCMP3155]|uniref:Uncharacterized protein n=1 Tax=Vitrella brassicaformis (strain CCMP3155) TaxID=1169540 RepID=A0A0G4EKF3_VITBC|nr:unnamed protein product [Vitrella brassicaformis CCMP3155]|eukprot:CEL97925.1 unnamed protein product [Vitrella brassicaformis CCMP3155]
MSLPPSNNAFMHYGSERMVGLTRRGDGNVYEDTNAPEEYYTETEMGRRYFALLPPGIRPREAHRHFMDAVREEAHGRRSSAPYFHRQAMCNKYRIDIMGGGDITREEREVGKTRLGDGTVYLPPGADLRVAAEQEHPLLFGLFSIVGFYTKKPGTGKPRYFALLKPDMKPSAAAYWVSLLVVVASCALLPVACAVLMAFWTVLVVKDAAILEEMSPVTQIWLVVFTVGLLLLLHAFVSRTAGVERIEGMGL